MARTQHIHTYIHMDVKASALTTGPNCLHTDSLYGWAGRRPYTDIITKISQIDRFPKMFYPQCSAKKDALGGDEDCAIGNWLFGCGVWLVGGFFERSWGSRGVGRNANIPSH